MQGMQRADYGTDRSRPAFYAGVVTGVLAFITFILIVVVMENNDIGGSTSKVMMIFLYLASIFMALTIMLIARLLADAVRQPGAGQGAVIAGAVALLLITAYSIIMLLLIYGVLKSNTAFTMWKVAEIIKLLGMTSLGLALLLLARKLVKLSHGYASSALPSLAALAATLAWATGGIMAVINVLKEGDVPYILPKLMFTFQALGEVFLMTFLFAVALFVVKSGSASRYAKPALGAGAAAAALDIVSVILGLVFIFSKKNAAALLQVISNHTGMGKTAAIFSGLAVVAAGITLALLAPLLEDFLREAAGRATAGGYAGLPGAAPYQPYPQPPAAPYPATYQPRTAVQVPWPAPAPYPQPAAVYQPPPSPPPGTNCPVCEASNPPGARFCRGCGREFDAGLL